MAQIAPLALADRSWDNVGVLVDSADSNHSGVVMLTVDLTPEVMEECIAQNVEVILAYHPPIFSPMKRLTVHDPKQRILLQAVRAGMSIYSPHTSLDAAVGGINDWLVDLLHPACQREPITPTEVETVTAAEGMGRLASLPEPRPLRSLVDGVKTALGLQTVRVAHPPGWAADRPVSTVAVCAGSGAGVFRKLRRRVDVLLTGEMGHHEVLAAVAAGQAVILCEHTNTERGYLQQRLAGRLGGILGDDVRIIVSQADRDPIQMW